MYKSLFFLLYSSLILRRCFWTDWCSGSSPLWKWTHRWFAVTFLELAVSLKLFFLASKVPYLPRSSSWSAYREAHCPGADPDLVFLFTSSTSDILCGEMSKGTFGGTGCGTYSVEWNDLSVLICCICHYSSHPATVGHAWSSPLSVDWQDFEFNPQLLQADPLMRCSFPGFDELFYLSLFFLLCCDCGLLLMELTELILHVSVMISPTVLSLLLTFPLSATSNSCLKSASRFCYATQSFGVLLADWCPFHRTPSPFRGFLQLTLMKQQLQSKLLDPNIWPASCPEWGCWSVCFLHPWWMRSPVLDFKRQFESQYCGCNVI